ncbi:MAG TPA: carboxypeptidase-like regulatory domain-containing protein [Edaphobacter sp.]|jgi:hypothetical protein|nr:carboxypeptidase-like regulatory domain-containing protein [Edaphobacter sp.]
MVPLRAIAITLLFAAWCSAQRSETAASGTVTGHVICADTNGPARIAHVVLQPVVDTTPAPKTGDHPRQISAAVTATLLDGSFTLPNIAPGDYYVFVEKLGYLSPFAQLSREDLNHPKPETAGLIAKLLTPVSVAANRTSTVEVRIYKGSAISGVIRFDDGAPDTNASVSVLTKDRTGKWIPFRTNLIAGPFGGATTDDQGHYRISGLPAGEYLLQTTLALTDIFVSGLFMESHSTSNNSRYSLNLYSGDSFRPRDAKSIKLNDGDEAGSVDITIPLSKLHAISGTVQDASSGRAINAGRVTILYSDDDTELAAANIDKEDSAFHFYYLPEGEYTLKVTSARDVTREEIPYPAGTVPPTHTVEKKLRDYDVEPQPLSIHSDITGIAIPAQIKSAARSPVTSQ